MIGTVLIGLFLLALVAGMPLATGLGVASIAVLAMAGFDQLAVPTNIYAGIAKYPLLAIPMFILAGMIFERSGVAIRLVRFVTAIVGEWTGSLAVVAVLVSMLLGGISGSGPADAAAVAAVMLPSMIARGYPKGFSAGLIAASGSTAIVIPPSVAFIVYSVMVPAATVPALFAAGLFPGMVAALCLLVPAIVISRKYGFGRDYKAERPPLGKSFIDAIWGLLAPVIILGGLRTGIFTPTEAAVVAVAYGIFVGMVVYRSISFRGPVPRPGRGRRAVGGGADDHRHRLGVRLGGQHAGHLRRRGQGAGRAALERVADAAVDQPAAARRGHVPRRDLDLPDPAAAAGADRGRDGLGPGVVRRDDDDQPRHRPVHAADGDLADDHLAHRRHRHGGDLQVGRSGWCWRWAPGWR